MVREDELLVKNVLEYFVYGRKSLDVGDDYARFLPDIYTKNHQIGIEVVNAELYADQRRKSFLEVYLQNNYTPKQQEILRALSQAQVFDVPGKLWLQTLLGPEKFQQYRDFLTFAKKKGDLHTSVLKGKDVLELEANIFQKRVQKKIEKLRQGNYKGCQHMNLCVTAWKRPRGYTNALENVKILEKLQQQYGATFERIFLIQFNCLYVYKNAKIELAENICKEDWEHILHQTFLEWDAHKEKVEAERNKQKLLLAQTQGGIQNESERKK